MKADIITIGDEILIGHTIDTNSTWIGNFLENNGIQTRVSWPLGIHMTEAYGHYCLESLPRTESVTKNVLSLSCYHTLKDQELVINKIKEFYG